MDIVSYKPLYWLFLLVPVVLAFRFSLLDRRRFLSLSVILRCLAVVLIALAMCRPFLAHDVNQTHVIFMIDTSESVDREQCAKAVEKIRKLVKTLDSGDSWSVMEFASHARNIELDELAERLAESKPENIGNNFSRESRIARSLLQGRMRFPAGKAKRIVLFTDSRETAGETRETLDVLAREGVNVVIGDLSSVTHPEVSVISCKPNTTSAFFGEKVRLAVKLSSNYDTQAKLRVYSRGVLQREAPISLKAGQLNDAVIDVIMNTPGSTVWTVAVVAEKDHFPLNNQASTTIDVKGKAKVLVLHREPKQMRQLVRALGKQGMELNVRGLHGLPETLKGILEFDAIVLADIPATALSTRQLLNLKSYVSDFGGGLVMLGSENSFGLGGYYQTPVEEVLPIVSRYEKEKERPSLAMMLVIDKSGSMEGLPIALARQAAKASAELLSPQDRVGIVAFDGKPYVVCEMRSAAEMTLICNAIDQISAGGGTNMFPAMQKGGDILLSTNARIKHMIVLGDGQSMPGAFLELAGEMAESNITVSTVALGEGADRQLMSEIARIGRGRYYETMDPATVPRIFTKETMEASRSAIREEPFLPVKVGGDDVIGGIDFGQAPLLLGYVMTRIKPLASVQLVTESGDPLLAVGKYGLGRAVAFTSDASERWASLWVQWEGFGKFWAQILRSCLRKSDCQGVDVRREEHPDYISFTLTSKNDASEPAFGEEWEALIVDENGRRKKQKLDQVGLAMYSVKMKQPTSEQLTVRIIEPQTGKIRVLHHQKDYPNEYRLAAKPDPSLSELPRLGQDLADSASLTVSAFVPLQNFLFLAAIFCMIGSIFFRRL